jgi:hypothetical protein
MGENTGKYLTKAARAKTAQARQRLLNIVGTTGLVAVVAMPPIANCKTPDLIAESTFQQRLDEARTVIGNKSAKFDPAVPANPDKQDVAQWNNWGNWGNAWRNY